MPDKTEKELLAELVEQQKRTNELLEALLKSAERVSVGNALATVSL